MTAAALLLELRTVLERGMPEPAARAVVARIQSAIAMPGSVPAAELRRAFEQLEDALEYVLLLPEAPKAQ